MAKSKLCVRKVTVEYVARGKVFTVDFSPMEVGSIFFSEDDRQAAQDKQNDRAKVEPNVPPVRERPFKPLEPLQEQEVGKFAFATSSQIGTAPDTGGPSLWWHTNACTWIHPDED